MRFSDLSEEVQRDLLVWFNRTKPSQADKRDLVSLYQAGRFHSWNCINCGDRCYFGNPENWGNFQGVRNLDFTSYPGCESSPSRRVKMCDQCRMHDTRTNEELELIGEGEPTIWQDCDCESMGS